MTIATIVYFSVQGFSLYLHAILITLFIALTAPVTTIFLMRAALFRERQKGWRRAAGRDDGESEADGRSRRVNSLFT